MWITGAEVKNPKYDFKSLKIRPFTYKRLVKLKASIESEKQELVSFDAIINNVLDELDKVETFSANDINKNVLPSKNA